MKTENIADKNYEILSKMFPNALTETITGYDDDGKPIVERAIDADVLRQEISCKVVEGKDERYQFTWPDKKKAVLLANTPINKTLRPCREESVDFDNTENLYIEGDNLEVLKLLHETYLGKIKMIYIDPPYNTGNDFVYEDDFTQSIDEYRENSGQFDDVGNRMVQNIESNGRFHTDWLNMIYPRLKLAKDLLCEDGVIFVSVDYNENFNMRKLLDEIFGQAAFIGEIYWESKTKSQNTITAFNKLQPKEREALIKVRVNQSAFRKLLMRRYTHCCLCDVDDESLLVASHIKPWAKSNHAEKVDVNNGLLLCPNHDKLFDRGYISFDNGGHIVISDELSENSAISMNIKNDMQIELSNDNIKYMEYHRNNVLK